MWGSGDVGGPAVLPLGERALNFLCSSVAVLAIVHLLADPSIAKRQIVVAGRELVSEYEEFVSAILHSR